jgi:hypothetical protein
MNLENLLLPNKIGIQSVRSGDGIGGIGCERKQMPLCNIRDKVEFKWRGANEHSTELRDSDDPTQKSAHFSRIITKETFSGESQSIKWSR